MSEPRKKPRCRACHATNQLAAYDVTAAVVILCLPCAVMRGAKLHQMPLGLQSDGYKICAGWGISRTSKSFDVAFYDILEMLENRSDSKVALDSAWDHLDDEWQDD